MNDFRRQGFLVFAFVCGVTVAEFRLISFLQFAVLPDNVNMTAGIVSGHPAWVTHQNRVFAPFAIQLLHTISHLSFTDCFRAFGFLMLLIANGTCYYLFSGSSDFNTHRAKVYTVTYAFLFLILQDPHWLLPWDYVDLTTILVFAYAVVMRFRSLWLFTVICLVELLNREAAIYVALWLVLDSVQPTEKSDQQIPFSIDAPRLFTGMALGVFCVGWTSFVRHKLLIEVSSTLPSGMQMIAGQGWTLPLFSKTLFKTTPLTTTMLCFFLGSFAVLLGRAWSVLGTIAWKVAALTGFIILCTFLFGAPLELRVWLTLMPFMLCFAHVRVEPSLGEQT